MNYINYLASWQTPEQGLKSAKKLVRKILAKPISEFLENQKTREMLELAYKVEAWFTHKAIIHRQTL
jgi:hypothetical protein